MASGQAIPTPTRKDLAIFAIMLPVFFALLGWLSVRRPGGMMIALIICGTAAIVGILLDLKQWKTRAWSLFIPAVLIAFMIMGSSGASAARLAGGWAVVGATLGAMVLLAPRGDAIYTFWLEAAQPIGMVISGLLLALTYYGVFLPIGLIMRTIRKDPLGLQYDRAASTYWIKHEPVTDAERYFRQF